MVLNDITNTVNSYTDITDFIDDSEEEEDSDNNSIESYDGNPKYCLGLCMLWCKHLHGLTNDSTANIDTYWITEERVSLSEFYEDNLDWISNYRNHIRALLQNLSTANTYFNNCDIYNRFNPIISNYNNILLRNPYYPNIDIIVMEYLPGKEAVAYIKTFWLRLIQKRWKKLFKERQEIIRKRTNPKTLHHRQLHGKWPTGLNNLPDISQIINF